MDKPLSSEQVDRVPGLTAVDRGQTWRAPRRRLAHFIVTIEGQVLFVLALLAFGGVAACGVSFVPLACAVPFLVTAAKRPWIGTGDVLRTRAYAIPHFRRIKLDDAVAEITRLCSSGS